MSHRFYSEPITRCKPRRSWGRTLIDGLVLLAFAALAGWLISLVKCSAAISPSVTSRGMQLAMMPWQTGAVMGLLAFFTVVGVWWAVKRVRSNALDAVIRWSVREPGEPLPLSPDDLRRILWAVTERVCTASDYIRKAQLDLSIEDYGDKLTAAQNDLRRVIQCLGDVMKHLNADAAGEGKE